MEAEADNNNRGGIKGISAATGIEAPLLPTTNSTLLNDSELNKAVVKGDNNLLKIRPSIIY